MDYISNVFFNSGDNHGPVIEVKDLSKHFGDFEVFTRLNLNIKKGEIFGLIGPNGSGKTTTISALLGILSADKGSEITIFGVPVPHKVQSVYPRIGYMPQDITLYNDITIGQNLRFFGKMNNIPRKKLEARIKEVLALVDMAEFEDRTIAKCSGGMQRRASLACALLHEPELLLLDEPTVGIDPELRIAFWDYFRRLADKGVTIVVTTHYLAESIKCDRIGFLKKQLIACGTPQTLQKAVQKALQLPALPDMEEVFIYYTKHHAPEALPDIPGPAHEGDLEAGS